MLNKVRARAPIDLPVEKWERSWGLTIFLTGLTFLFIVLPLLASLLLGLVNFTGAAIVGVASGILVLLLTGLFLTPR